MKDLGKRPVTRRSVLDWLGKSVVIALSSNLLLSCAKEEDDIKIDKEKDDNGLSDDPAINLPLKDISMDSLWTVYIADPQDLISLLNNWKLVVYGLVENPMEITYAKMLNLPRKDQISDLHCINGWTVSDILWNGFHLSSLFELVKPLASASHVTFNSYTDIYLESITMEDALNPSTMMAYGINGSTIPFPHGFPLRLVIPYKWGYKNAKFVYGIELTNSAVMGFWEKVGNDYEGNIPADRLKSL